jgi:GntR family transcriptional regulator, carbon starvation induced regulator
MGSFTPPSQKTGSAFDLLHRDILNGTYAPGAPLRVAALSAAYGFSATPLREALSRLAEKQLVVSSANRGWRVAPVSLAEFEDLQAARLTVEGALLVDAVERGGLDWESGIVAAHYRLTQVTPPLGEDDTLPTRQIWIDTHDSFHNSPLAAGRSNWLKSFYQQVTEQLQRHHQALLFHTRSINPGGPAHHTKTTDALLRRALSVPRHTELMEIVLDRDATRALAALRDHVDITRAIYRSIVGNEGRGADGTSADGPPLPDDDTRNGQSTERTT